MSSIDRQSVTVAEFEDLLARRDDSVHDYELIHGEVFEVSPSGTLPSIVTNFLARAVTDFVVSNDLGVVVSAEGGYILSESTVVAPDVSVILKPRLSQITSGFFRGAPDFAAEVQSQSDTKRAMRRKAEMYLAAGTRLVWLVFTDDRAVEVYQPGLDVSVVGIDGSLSGADTLPGFTLAVRDIFPNISAE